LAGRDITEGDGNIWDLAADGLPIARGMSDIGIGSSSAYWQNTDIAYDVALGGMPFVYATNDARPHIRQTASFKKQQFDNAAEPGEQTLEGWWIRSQMSFHSGTGIKFYDPATTDENGHYRFTDSRNVDVWTKGQVTLLKETAALGAVNSGTYKIISIMDGSTNKILGWIPTSTTINNYTASGTAVAYTDVTSIAQPLDTAILAIATDGTNLFIADNDHIYTGPISTPTAGYSRYYNTGSEKVVLAWVKQRLVACIGASIYELTNAKGTTHTLPTPVYTHPNAGWTWTSVSESGGAIYAAGYAGGTSAIYKFTLSTAGVMPTLTSGVIAAQLPIGEVVNKIEYYLGYLMIGTNKGVRAASISEQDGSINYGPLIIEESNGVYDFAFRDRFVWATGSVGGYAGLYRIDLSNQLEPLRFAYATDAYLDGVTGYATSVDFVGNTDQIAFTTSGSNGIAIQSATVLAPTGYLTTGNIRYGTLEPKNYKRLLARGDFTYGSVILETVDKDGVEYDHITYSGEVEPVEVTTTQPEVAQEYVAYKFAFTRHAADTTKGPNFKGYQAKATIATPRQRVIQFYVYNMDTETDRYNVEFGYSGRAIDRLDALENIEQSGDIVTWQDLNTQETRRVQIESIQYIRVTPPDKESTGDGGILQITVRTV
jgi:hypothetical protein